MAISLDIIMILAILVNGYLNINCTKYQSNVASGLNPKKRLFILLPFSCYGNQSSQGLRLVLAILKEDFIGHICANFDYFLNRSIKEKILSKLLKMQDRQRTTADDRRNTIPKAYIGTMYQMSLQLYGII